MHQHRNRILIALTGTVLAVGAGAVVLWPRLARVFTRLRTYAAMPVYAEPIPGSGDLANLIFLHHSTGRNLIEEGGIRPSLTELGYQFWDHDFNHIGLTLPDGTPTSAHYRIPGMWGRGNTDVDGLAALFAQPVTEPPENAFSRLLQHEVIIVKSCYPNSAVKNDAMLAQFQTYYRQMRDVMDAHPDHLFIIMTSPPLHPLATTPADAQRARAIADWLQSPDYLTGHPNLFVFDFFDLLADPDTHTLRPAYQRTAAAAESHPNRLANESVAPLFVAFIDQSIKTYTGQVDPVQEGN